jgi:transposase
MRKRYRVKLSKSDRKYLNRFVKTGIARAREILRARILLLADESQRGKGKKDAEIAKEVQVCMRTVAATRERYLQGGLERALRDLPRSGQPPKLSGRDEAKLTAIVCSEPPAGRSRWSIRLLADRMVELKIVDHIAPETVRKVLKKTSLNLSK